MKILIPVICFGKSGGYRVLSRLADELLSLGHQVEFLSPDGSEKPYYPTQAKVNWADDSGNINQNENYKTETSETFLSIQKKLTRALHKIPKEAFDVIFANHSLTVPAIFLNRLTYKTLYYIQAYEPEYYRMAGGVKNRILAYLSEITYNGNIYKVVNADIYRHYKKLQVSRVIYPGIDFDVFYPKPAEKDGEGIQNETIIIGTVGRLEKYKGIVYVLNAFKLIKQKYPNAQLHIAFGNPADFKDVDGVFCFQPDGDVALSKFYRSLNYYFCAGYVQLGAFHYPLAEAMRCGVPVVTTQYYPSCENNAWVAGPYSTDSLVEQFEKAYHNKSETEKKRQQAITDTKQFDWKNAALQLEVFFHEVVLSVKYIKTV